MVETYKKIDGNTLEITSTSVYQEERRHLEEEIRMAESEIIESQKRIDELKAKIAILNK